MRKLTFQALIALLPIFGFGTTADMATAQDKSQLPRVIEKPVDGPRTIRPVQKRIEGQPNMILLNDPNGIKAVRKIELGKFWIGLNCAEVSPALRSQLKLKDGIGLLVVNAFEGSPSQKAGLKQHDIVVKADDTEIGAVGQLIEAVQKAGDSELKLEIMREGQSKTITVKSAERPKGQQGDFVYLPSAGGEHRLLFSSPDGALTLVEPGVVLNNKSKWTNSHMVDRRLPNGVSITVTRKAGEKASVHVEQDDKTWDITPDQLDQLPEDLRPHVQAMLGPVPMRDFPPQYSQNWAGWLRNRLQNPPNAQSRPYIQQLPKFTPFAPPGNGIIEQNAPPEKPESEIEELKRELSEQMKQLRKAIDELKKSNESK
ncbi:MAG: PDZ domain-containing protein [Planctomycetales bacterium]|jgi:hypothetical protein